MTTNYIQYPIYPTKHEIPAFVPADPLKYEAYSLIFYSYTVCISYFLENFSFFLFNFIPRHFLIDINIP